MLILAFLGIYFDAVVVFVTNSSLLFRFAMAILCAGVGGEGVSNCPFPLPVFGRSVNPDFWTMGVSDGYINVEYL